MASLLMEHFFVSTSRWKSTALYQLIIKISEVLLHACDHMSERLWWKNNAWRQSSLFVLCGCLDDTINVLRSSSYRNFVSKATESEPSDCNAFLDVVERNTEVRWCIECL
ncbi:unnamed protein product [Urochloa humidicola]